MRAEIFWKTVTLDHSNFLESLITLLEGQGIRYCVIGGQGVNAYVEPLVSLDLDLVIAVDQLQIVEPLLSARYELVRFPHSLNIAAAGSNLGNLSRPARPRTAGTPRSPGLTSARSARDIMTAGWGMSHNYWRYGREATGPRSTR